MLRWRLFSSALLIVAIVLALVLHGWAGAVVFTLFMAALSWIAAAEFMALVGACGVAGFPRLTCVFAVLLSLAVGIAPAALAGGDQAYTRHDLLLQALNALVLGVFLVCGFRQVFRRGPAPAAVLNFFVSLAGLIYICWTLSFIPRLYFSTGFSHEGRWLALFLVAVTKAGDIGAYVAGSLSAKLLKGGNHKIEDRVSPKKSWEGLAGGMVFCVLIALLMLEVAPKNHLHFHGLDVLGWPEAVFWGVFCALIGYWGDVAESALKRAANMKNSGAVPGLGGVLDVVDSLTLVCPFFYAWLQIRAAFGG